MIELESGMETPVLKATQRWPSPPPVTNGIHAREKQTLSKVAMFCRLGERKTREPTGMVGRKGILVTTLSAVLGTLFNWPKSTPADHSLFTGSLISLPLCPSPSLSVSVPPSVSVSLSCPLSLSLGIRSRDPLLRSLSRDSPRGIS